MSKEKAKKENKFKFFCRKVFNFLKNKYIAIAKVLASLVFLAMTFYGMVYVPYLKAQRDELLISIISQENYNLLLKDDRSCKLNASNTVAELEKKSKKKVEDKDKERVYIETYSNCMWLMGRDDTANSARQMLSQNK